MTSLSTGWRAPLTGPSLWTPWTRVRGRTRARSPGRRGRLTPGRSIAMVTGARGYPPPHTTGGRTPPKLNNNLIYVNKYSYETNFKIYISIVIIHQTVKFQTHPKNPLSFLIGASFMINLTFYFLVVLNLKVL